MSDQFTRDDVTTLLLEVMDWTYVQATRDRPMTDAEKKVIDDIRARLAAPRPEPEPVLMELAQQMKPLDADIAAILYANLDSLYIEDEPAAAPRPEPEKERAEVAAPARSGVGQTEEIDSFTPEAYHEKRHPGYVIGNHWLETAYSRICAGESEDAILEDYELVREPRLRDLRRDAERYRWMKREVKRIPPSWGLVGWDAAIDAAMQEDKT